MSTKTTSGRELLARWIEPDAAYPGDPEAHIANTGIPVWALVGHYKANGQHAGLTAEDYRLPIEAIKAALAYYRGHREIIDMRLTANDAAASS
jgi:uncharacterized protein (DUF433 family)